MANVHSNQESTTSSQSHKISIVLTPKEKHIPYGWNHLFSTLMVALSMIQMVNLFIELLTMTGLNLISVIINQLIPFNSNEKIPLM
jgi:hypothetical protein